MHKMARRAVTSLIVSVSLVAYLVASVEPSSAGADGIDTPGFFRNGAWYLSNSFGGTGDYIFGYGNPGDIALTGDWNGDGIDTPGVFRNAYWYLSNGFSGSVDTWFLYGNPTDVPVVGDWNNDGIDTVGIVRGDSWQLTDGFGGNPNRVFAYGLSGDKPVVGDWNNDGIDTPGVFRNATWYLSDVFGGNGDHNFNYGLANDTPVAGDWNNDGIDTVGIVRGDSWQLTDGFGGNPNRVFAYGLSGDKPVVGDWGGSAPPGTGVRLDAPDTLHANGADLSWGRWEASLGGTFTGYEIHRSLGGDFTPSAATLVATVKDQAVTSYHDTTAAPSRTFTYKVVVNGYASNGRAVTLPADGQAVKSIQLGPTDSQGTYAEYDSAATDCSNYGSADTLYVGDDLNSSSAESWKYRPLIAFDLRDIPAAAHVNSATLQLYRDQMPPPQAVTVGVYRVTSAWMEGTGSRTAPTTCTGDGATWHETQGGVKWKAGGGDYDPTLVASVSHSISDVAGWDTFDVASAVQKWVDGTAPNLGLLLRFTDETPRSRNWFVYHSDDTYDPTLRPKLQIQYADGSHTQPPSVTVGSPGPGDNVGGTVTLAAGASDDGRVTKVDFLVDGAVIASDTTAPFGVSWSSTSATNAAHSITAKAYDDAGNATTSSAVSVNVDNSAPPATSVTSPASGASVSGTPTVTASASDDRGVSHVEFYVDGNRFTDLPAGPYNTTLATTSSTDPVYDGAHTLTTKAYDAGGHVTTSTSVPITVANAPAGSQYKATFSSTETPQAVTYDPALATQDKAGVNVTVTNASTLTWSTTNVVLRYRWISSDPTPVYTDGSDVALPAAVAPGASQTVTVLVSPPALPDGVTRARYTLRFDLFDKVASAWFAAKGNQPLENPVIVNKALVREALGLERYYHYVGRDVGAGLQQLTNVANGNSILRWTPFDEPGRGLATVLDLTYNALEKKCVCPAGNNWSLSVSSLSRLGSPIDIHPNKGDQISGLSNKFIELTDGDGTTLRFTDSNSDGYWEAPAGVHLYLRNYSTTDTSKWWAFTRPDRVTFFYDQDGFPTSVADPNGNTLTFTEAAPAPADDPGGPKLHVTKVTDAAGRSFDITYYTKADAKKPQIRGKVKQITDHLGRALLFDYYFDGNLLRMTQKGGTNPDGSFLADRSFVFTYTTSDGSGPAIATASARVDPDPGTSNESTRLYSVRDPRGKETLFAYLGPGAGTDRWKLASLTDRAGSPTTFAYDTINRVTTVTEPLSRMSKYAYDIEGKVTRITNPLNQGTTVAWSADRAVSRVTEPTGVFTSYAYNDNGYLTDIWNPDGSGAALTTTGNEITDSTRQAGAQGDGRPAPDSSYGVWEGTTNLGPNGGLENGLSLWYPNGGVMATDSCYTTLSRAGAAETVPKFGSYSLKLTTTADSSTYTNYAVNGACATEGSIYGTRLPVTPGATYSASAWLKAGSGVTRARMFLAACAASSTCSYLPGTGHVTLTSTWQRATATATVPATVGGTSTAPDNISLFVVAEAPVAAGASMYVDGAQIEQKALSTPYVETAGSVASRPASRIQGPASLLGASQGWAAFRVRYGFPSSALSSVVAGNGGTALRLLSWQNDNSNRILLVLQSNGDYGVFRQSGGAGASATAPAGAFNAGGTATVVARWDGSNVSLSVNGGAFVSVANSAIPTLTAQSFDLGSSAGSAQWDGEILWATGGAGAIGDADATSLNGFGDGDPSFGSVPGSPSFLWAASGGDYLNGGGNRTSLTYDNSTVDANDVSGKWEAGRSIPHISDLATKTDPKGVATPTAGDYQWTFAHDAKGNVTGVTDPLGKTTTNAYNPNGTLASTTDANGHVTSYPVYDNNGLATTIVDPIGNATGDATNHRTTFAYDAAGELLSVQDPVHQGFGAASRSNASFFDYDPFGRMIRQSAPKSTAVEPGNLIWTGAAFDPNDNVVTQTYPHYGTTTDPGGDKTTMTYDDMDRLTAQVVPHDPASTDPVQQSHKSTYTYDGAGRLTVQTDPKGVLTTNTDKDFATFFDYDPLDRVVAQTRYQVDSAGAVMQTQRTHDCYDLAGDLRSETAAKGDAAFPGCPAATTPYTPLSGNYTTKYDYDVAHEMLSTADPLGRRHSSTYDADGDIDSLTDENGTTSTLVYDQKGQLIQQTQPFRSGTNAKNVVMRYQYDPVGNLVKLISPRAYDASPDKQTFTQYVSSYQYDANDQLVRELLPTSSSDTQQLYVHHAYDANEREIWTSLTTGQALAADVVPSEKSQFSYFDSDWMRTSKDPAEPMVTFDYTAKGEQMSRSRPVSTTGTDETETWSYFADGLEKEKHDANGGPTTYTYDANGSISTETAAGGVQSSIETPIVVQQTYDGLDRLTKIRQQKTGKPWRYTTYGYDVDDNIVHQEDDATENSDGTVVAGRQTDFTYNQNDEITEQIDHGLMTACTDDQRLQYTYTPTGDRQDEIVSRPGTGCTDAAPLWSVKQQTTIGYFLDGSPSTLKVWNGPSASASLVQSHAIAYEDGAGVYLNGNQAGDTFTISSPLTGAPCQQPSSCTTTYTYDAKDRLVTYDNARGGLTNYTLQPSGELKTEAFSNGSGSNVKTYTYNAPNGIQLSSLTRQVTSGSTTTTTIQRFFYTHGDLVCVTQDDGTISARVDCPSPFGSTVSPRLKQSYSYDNLDRLTGYQSYGSDAQTDSGQWTYDALDRASSEQEAHATNSISRTLSLDYFGLSTDVAKESWIGSGATTKTYSYDADGDKVSLTDSGRNQDLLYSYNSHSDVSQLIDLAGRATATYGYRPYGDTESGAGAITQGDNDPKGANGTLNSYRYSAKRFDTAADSLNMGARFLSPDYGSFLQEDYLRDALDDRDLSMDRRTNTRYGLAGGDPVNFAEVDGHQLSGIFSRSKKFPRPRGWTVKMVRNARFIYELARYSGLTPAQAREMVGAANAESTLGRYPVNRTTGAKGLFQLLREFQTRARILGGVSKPWPNTCAILTNYKLYWATHRDVHPGSMVCAREVEASGTPLSYYQGRLAEVPPARVFEQRRLTIFDINFTREWSSLLRGRCPKMRPICKLYFAGTPYAGTYPVCDTHGDRP